MKSKFFKLRASTSVGVASSKITMCWNFEKHLCPVTLQPIDRSLSWFAGDVKIAFQRILGKPKLDFYFHAPFVFANDRAKLFFETNKYPVSFKALKKIPLDLSEQDYYDIDAEDEIYLLETQNRFPVYLDSTQIEWQKDCPGCGRTYPLFHTMKNPVIITPKGCDTRIFALEQWPESYLYINQVALKEMKKAGLTGIEDIKTPFAVCG